MNTAYKKYLIVPIPKNPYSRIGPKTWQDWYRQVKLTIKIARGLKEKGNKVDVAILSNFKPKGQPSEIEVYTKAFTELAPELNIIPYRETHETFSQVKKSLEINKEPAADQLIFVTAWMQYPRVQWLARKTKATHYAVFGIPQPSFAIIDPICIIFEPIFDLLGLGNHLRKIIVRRREKGKIL